ncbi:hypothetical protein ACQJBY_010298 [Aegilops geniculata]
MGLEFEDDCSYYLRLAITTPALHLASTLYIVFGYSTRHLDAIVVAALLQAILGGSAAHFYVAQCSPLVFCFHVASARVAESSLPKPLSAFATTPSPSLGLCPPFRLHRTLPLHA